MTCPSWKFNNPNDINGLPLSLKYELYFLSGENYVEILQHVYFIEKEMYDFHDASENCKTKFGKGVLGKLFEPKEAWRLEKASKFD